MIKLVAAALLLTLCQAASTGKLAPVCTVSDWSVWSKCERANLCPCETSDAQQVSYSVPVATPEYDDGRARMSILKDRKRKQWDAELACREAGTCPEFMVPPSIKGQTTACQDGMAGTYPCLNIDLESFTNFNDLCVGTTCSSARGNDIWGWTDPETGREYAIMGMSTGTSFVDITDPVNPSVLAYLPTRTSSSSWRDMKVYKDHAFIVSEAANHGMQVFDLTSLRGIKAGEGKVVQADAEYLQFGNAHNIAINEDSGYAYVVGQTRSGTGFTCVSPGGLHIINIQDPKNPVYTACFNNDGYTHDAECVIYHGPDTEFQGREICFNSNENTLTIVDVDDKDNLVMLARVSYEGYAYTHQNWLTEDHTVLLLDDEADESRSSDKRTRTYVWDVTSLRNPELKTTHYSTQNSIDHNQYIKGDYAYQANYQAGLRILHIDQDNYELSEVAYFDVYPSGTAAAFNGAWSTYPYFESGSIIVSSIEYGLFVVKANIAAMELLRDLSPNYGHQNRARATLTEGPQCPVLSQTRLCDAGPC